MIQGSACAYTEILSSSRNFPKSSHRRSASDARQRCLKRFDDFFISSLPVRSFLWSNAQAFLAWQCRVAAALKISDRFSKSDDLSKTCILQCSERGQVLDLAVDDELERHDLKPLDAFK